MGRIRRKRVRYGADEGMALVEAWRASGELSRLAWCRATGHSPSRLAYWLRRLCPDAGEAGDSPGFVEIPVEAVDPTLVVAVGRARIEVGSRFDAALLRAVVEALSC